MQLELLEITIGPRAHFDQVRQCLRNRMSWMQKMLKMMSSLRQRRYIAKPRVAQRTLGIVAPLERQTPTGNAVKHFTRRLGVRVF